MEEALALVVKVMAKSLDSTSLSSEKLEFSTVSLKGPCARRRGVPLFPKCTLRCRHSNVTTRC